MIIKFDKYQGTGNDFIIINIMQNKINLNKKDIELLCNRKFGIGADGLMTIDNDDKYDFKLNYYNSDGNISTMCGNGGRCIAKYAFLNNIAKNKIVFSAIDGIHEAWIEKDNNIVKISMIDVDKITNVKDGFTLNTGSPHFVTFVNNINEIDVNITGKKFADDSRFAPHRTNVNFVKFDDSNNKIFLLTYERGVEAETLSCGTGAVASAICLHHSKLYTSTPINIITKGGNLLVDFEYENNIYKNIHLAGKAEFVFDGTIKI